MSENKYYKELVDLNEVETIRKKDPGGMLQIVAGLPEQCEKALRLGQDCEPVKIENIKQVVMLGLGGSAIGGDLLRVYAAFNARVPIMVNRDYRLSAYVGEETLCIATSYSGNTEETLFAYREARRRGAKLIAITSGGDLKKMATEDGIPLIEVPPGLPPRSAIGYLFLPALVVLREMGLIQIKDNEFDELITILKRIREELGPEISMEINPAKRLAYRLFGKIPLIYGAAGTTEVVATRWKGQINENSKALAYANVFPELNHNEIVGFTSPGSLVRQLQVVFLRDVFDHPRVARRIEITKSLLDGRVAGVMDVHGKGESRLAHTFSLVYYGDYVSLYLALLYGNDPKPVEIIERLKKELAKE